MRYRWLSVLFVLTVVSLTCLAIPLAQQWHDISVKHAWNAVPDNWECLGPPPPGITIDLYVALQPKEENILREALYEVSTPGHPKYGKHLSKKEVAKLVEPHPDTLELVHSWLAHHGVHSSSISTSHGGGWLTVTDVPVPQANELLGASYQLYRLAGTNDTAILRTVGYALPKVLHPHVNTVAPTTFFASAHALQLTPHGHSSRTAGAPEKVASRGPVSVLSSRDEDMTPEELRRLYNTYTYQPTALTQNTIGVLGYGHDFPSPTDLDLFMSMFRPGSDPDGVTFTVELVNGGEYDPSWPGFEANLDLQYSQAIAYPTPHIFYSVGGQLMWTSVTDEPIAGDFFLAWVDHLIDQEKIPQTMTTSYGVNEKEVPEDYAWGVCRLFSQLGVLGISILFPSGDHGVGVGNCQDASGRVQFIPKFPATCPYITSVGGTTQSDPEVAAALSGGGFSNYFRRPAYQNVVVPAFLHSLGNQYDGIPDGRGVPDISAQALNFVIVIHSAGARVSGTSCSTPVRLKHIACRPTLLRPSPSIQLIASVQTVAGIISLLNDFLISEGKSPLGFLNPLLYSTAGMSGLNDIISGSNPGCDTDGFTAIAGWDPVTGLGTPDFSRLLHVLRARIDPGNQRRTFSDVFNKSDTAATRDAKGIDEYFLINSSTRAIPAYKHD
ncbi:subtilisin-like protein [Lactarius akahatsu]|uniref:Subtilisin-like protein n=1 Tax=Lactarius akahatsu TaxID=416441 RepID=A0AAD4L443_9AGAM|nr:subtilisin-like protein [Lactarius akahatsu]